MFAAFRFAYKTTSGIVEVHQKPEAVYMTVFTILLGGEITVTPRLKSQTAGTSVIAADGGIRHAKSLNLSPVLWMGDFDSTDKDMKKSYSNVPRISFPCDKDMTDGELAVNTALEKGASRLILCGAFGGDRTDHTLLHMTMSTTLAERNIPSVLTSGGEEGWPLVPGSYRFDLPDSTAFSIIAFSPIEGLSIHGAKWPLYNARVNFGSSLTLSNKICGTLGVSLQSGRGILLTKP